MKFYILASQRSVWVIAGVLWFFAATTGMWVLATYENNPGVPATPKVEWPAASDLAPATDRPTLVMLAHPQCTCTQASLTELAEILARARVRPRTYVLFLRPKGFAQGWEYSDLWRIAATLPDTTVVTDVDEATAEQFGAVTSGQTFLYDARGTLLFSGGVTSARGHAGDNDGRMSVVALLNRSSAIDEARTRVFGCSLFAPEGNSRRAKK